MLEEAGRFEELCCLVSHATAVALQLTHSKQSNACMATSTLSCESSHFSVYETSRAWLKHFPWCAAPGAVSVHGVIRLTGCQAHKGCLFSKVPRPSTATCNTSTPTCCAVHCSCSPHTRLTCLTVADHDQSNVLMQPVFRQPLGVLASTANHLQLLANLDSACPAAGLTPLHSLPLPGTVVVAGHGQVAVVHLPPYV